MTLDHKNNIAYWVDILSEAEFIRTAIAYAAEKGSDVAVVNWLYKLGRDSKKLNTSFEQFQKYIRDGHAPYPRTPYRSRWCRRDCGYYREGTKYRKNTSHKKKELSQKQIWREASGITRDKSKRYSWSSARKATARKAANGSFRQWCKRMIEIENYDAFSRGNDDWKLVHDPWDWD